MSRLMLPVTEEQLTIPARVFFVWVGAAEPTWVSECRELWRAYCAADSFELVEVGNEDCERSLTRRLAEKYPLKPVEIADFLRVELVHRYGGLYMDADSMPVRSLREFGWIGDRPAWLGQGHPWEPGKPEYNNATFGFPEGHPYLEAVWNAGVSALARGVTATWHKAGPATYRRTYLSRSDHFGVELPHGPFYQYGKKDKELELSLGRMETAEELLARMDDDVVVVHFSMQTWQDTKPSDLNLRRWEARA